MLCLTVLAIPSIHKARSESEMTSSKFVQSFLISHQLAECHSEGLAGLLVVVLEGPIASTAGSGGYRIPLLWLRTRGGPLRELSSENNLQGEHFGHGYSLLIEELNVDRCLCLM